MNTTQKTPTAEPAHYRWLGIGIFAAIAVVLASSIGGVDVAAEFGHSLPVLTLMFGAYFLPGIVAQCRGHQGANAITMRTLLLGWTGLGWVIALVWAMTAPSTR